MASFKRDVPEYYQHSRHIYAFRHALNTVDIFQPTQGVPNAKLWLIFIHGGAWRDPDIDSWSIVPALHHLNPDEHPIAGVASINYGLSPYPSHATDPSSPKDPSRNNMHPQHLEDVIAALKWMQNKYKYGKDYILAGHSSGATLAFQVLTRPIPKQETFCKLSQMPVLPYAIAGLNGIYDLAQLSKDYSHMPMYQIFLESAFGANDCGKWKIASPVGWPYATLWSRGKIAVLAHGDDDELVNWTQTNSMMDSLNDSSSPHRRDVIIKTQGGHGEIWSEGKELARVLLETLKLTTDALGQDL